LDEIRNFRRAHARAIARLVDVVPSEHVIPLDADSRNTIAERRFCSGPATVERCVAVTTLCGVGDRGECRSPRRAFIGVAPS
jgi:hypothetical protein